MSILRKKSAMSLVVLTVCVVAAASVFIGCDAKKGKKSETTNKTKADSTVIKVVVADVVEQSFEDWGSFSADLRGIEDAVLMAPNQGGRVAMVKPVGSRVEAGESLYDIDSEKYGAALEAAKAQVEVANGELERAKVNVEKGSLGRSALDGTNLGFQTARVLLANAQRAYDDCIGKAPFSGMLVSRSIEKYQSVAPGMPTVRISRTDKLEAVIAIPETESSFYSEGMKTDFHLLQNVSQVFQGTLSSIDRAVDTKSRTVSARIVVTNSNGLLKPGMVGRVAILKKKYTKAIVVPATALLRLQNGIYAMTVESGIVHQKQVTVGATTVETALITDGLNAGDKLIVTGGFQVSDGTKVTY